jgi:hypothetical protein
MGTMTDPWAAFTSGSEAPDLSEPSPAEPVNTARGPVEARLAEPEPTPPHTADEIAADLFKTMTEPLVPLPSFTLPKKDRQTRVRDSGYARRIKRRQRAEEVLRLHGEGHSLAAIGAQLGVSEKRVANSLAYALSELIPKADDHEQRAAIERRLNRVADEFADFLNHDDPEIRLRAAEGLRATEADRARLLGLTFED